MDIPTGDAFTSPGPPVEEVSSDLRKLINEHSLQQSNRVSEGIRLLSDDRGIITRDWLISSKKCHISTADDCDRIAKDLDISVPEMVYGKNYVQFHYLPAGVNIRFTCVDALRGCLLSHREKDALQVSFAKDWQAAQRQENLKPIDVSYDWTYTTDYTGTVESFNLFNDDEAASKSATHPRFTSTSARIDYDKLRVPEPIQWYDMVTLYEDELHDHGHSAMIIKVRVMPSCFFCLARNWVRVDNVFARIRDTRVFHEFGSHKVLRERTSKKIEFEKDGDNGSANMTDFINPDLFEKSLKEESFECDELALPC